MLWMLGSTYLTMFLFGMECNTVHYYSDQYWSIVQPRMMMMYDDCRAIGGILGKGN